MDVLTNQKFLYRNSPVAYSGQGKLTTIKGNSQVFNQLVQNGNFTSTASWTNTYTSSFTTSNNVASFVATQQNGRIGQTIYGVINNHTYLVTATIKISSGYARMQMTSNPALQVDTTVTGSFQTLSLLYKSTATESKSLQIRDRRTSGWDAIQVKNVMCFDLTLMGLDSLTLDEIKQWFSTYYPLDYYDTQQSLISFNGTGLKTSDGVNESTLSLPISTYFPTGMKSAGSIYDELVPNKATTRIGRLNLGSLAWSYSTNTQGLGVFISYPTGISTGVVGVNTIQCEAYKSIACINANVATSAMFPDKTICQSVGGKSLRIRDDSYTDATTFKNAMNGKYFVFELATPTETTISPELDLSFTAYENGTEEILPTNTSTPTIAPIICDIEYSAYANIIINTFPSGIGLVKLNPQQVMVGGSVQATAIGDIGYRFSHWQNEQTINPIVIENVQDGETITAFYDEIAQWTLYDKYDILNDVLRIEQNCKTFQDDLNHLLGQSINLNIKLDWTRNDIPTINHMERIRSNLQTLINYITIYNLPSFGNTFLYTNANNFEEALRLLDDFVQHQALEDKPMAGFYCAGEPLKLMAERS